MFNVLSVFVMGQLKFAPRKSAILFILELTAETGQNSLDMNKSYLDFKLILHFFSALSKI